MPLRQSRLNFNHRLPTASTEALHSNKTFQRVPSDNFNTSTDAEADTIVVDTSDTNEQLPTPSESSIDVSSQDGVPEDSEALQESSDKPVVHVRKSKFREEAVDGPFSTGEVTHRSVSGETLVNNVSQSSLLKSGITALDIGWNMDNAVATNVTRELSEDAAGDIIEIDSSTVAKLDETEDEAERLARAVARKAKMEQTAKKWEQRRKAAEKNATRRSGRASLVIGKAGEVISGIASSVLGKRARDGADSVDRPDSKLRRVTADNEETVAKKLRPSAEKPLPPTPKHLPPSKDKKWLCSGLYAGQARTFDARLSESGNKKKQTVKEAQPPPNENKLLPMPMFAGERLLKQGRCFRLPFDVFSPVPPGQAKPEGWRKQNKNVIIGDAVDFWRSSRVQESSTCICTDETGCDHNCLNRTMYYECDTTNCNLPEYICGNRQWTDLGRRVKMNLSYTIGVDVIKTNNRGHGVRANRTFNPGQIILEYSGEIITQEECERRMRTDYKTNECYYLMLFDQNMILDATRGSMARFVNHSCEPNCTMEKWTVRGVPRMALFAGERGIMTGEELTYDYNFDPYSQKNVQQCHCGSKNCRGFLGPRPKDVQQKSPDVDGPKKKTESRIAGAKRKVAEVLSESTSRLNKKRKTETAAISKPARKGTPKKVVAVKKVTQKKVTVVKNNSQQHKSALRKIITDTTKKTTTIRGKRVVSSGSMKEKLLPKSATKGAKTPGRSSSLKKKATSLKNTVVNTVRGRIKQ